MPDLGLLTTVIVLAIVMLTFAGVPLAFTTGSIAVVLCLAMFGPSGLFLIASRTFSFLDSYLLVSVPLFILMASILQRSGIAKDLYNALYLWSGRMPGGVAVMTTVVAMILAATVGVIGGEMVLLGLVALPQLLRLGYERRLAVGTICAGGSLGTMIPPSIILVFYGLTVGAPVGDLFLATLIPGLVLVGLYVAYIMTVAMARPHFAPPPTEEEQAIPLAEKLVLLRGVALPVFVAASVMGSIYLGIASVTEAAGMGVAGTVIATLLRREFSLQLMREAAYQTMMTCGMVLWLVLGTNALIGVYNLMGGIQFAQALLTDLPFAPIVVVLIMIATFIAMGFFLDWIGIMLLTMPIFAPTVVALGYDLVWFGVVFNLSMQIAYLTPPFAPAAFYLKGVAPPEITLETIYASLWPFIGLQIIALVMLLSFPGLALWLPRLVYG